MAQTAEELRLQLQDQRAAVSRDLEELGDKVSPGQVAARTRYRVRSGIRDTKDSLMEKVMGTRDSAGELASGLADRSADVGDAVRQAPEQVEHRIEGNPLAAGLIAFGLGLLTASLFPETEVEQRAAARLEPTLREVSGRLGDLGAGVKEQAVSGARDAVDELSDEARSSAEHVGERAKDAAQQAQREVRGAGG